MTLPDPSLTPESIRAAMAIPSTAAMRGLKDGVGFATTPEAMAAVYAASARPPAPAQVGPTPRGTVVGAICPHDDFLYAGRVYRAALERITAKTVVIVGTFHGFRHFEPSPFGWLDVPRPWFAPDGPVASSPLREAMFENELARHVFERLAAVEAAAFDLEHSIEPIVAWLRHARPDLEILPVLPPSYGLNHLQEGARSFGSALANAMAARGLELGRDVAVVISADAVHYGADFQQTRYGTGGPESYNRATAEDRRILTTTLAGENLVEHCGELYDTFVDRDGPNGYGWTWCGRFAIPFGITLLDALAGPGRGVVGWPLTYGTSLDPSLDLEMPPLGFTAPATTEHFVGYPAVAFTLHPADRGD